jgi:hypothetical protein
MTARRSFIARQDACCICGAAVHSTSATTTDPEAPEMLHLPADAWLGIVQDRPAGETRIIFCCSKRCLTNLLREEP